jgi:hypothetical protein
MCLGIPEVPVYFKTSIFTLESRAFDVTAVQQPAAYERIMERHGSACPRRYQAA